MRMRGRVCLLVLGFASVGWGQGCLRAVVEGEVSEGKSFEAVFTPGLKFLLEPIASGWIVRVLPVGEARGAHDYAELATPPYQSVTPLAIGTDFSFRAQDALGWNPRRFRYLATAAEFRTMLAMYAPAMAGDRKAVNALTELAAGQPEVELRILDARLVPGTNDQWQMATAVASHFETTPHTVEPGGGAGGRSPLGKVTWMKFRVGFDLRPGVKAAKGVVEEKIVCGVQLLSKVQTTAGPKLASEHVNPEKKK